METIKKTAEYTIFLKSNGRHAVQNARRRWVNGDDKVAILLAEDLIKAPPPPAPVEASPEESEEASAEAQETDDAADDTASAE